MYSGGRVGRKREDGRVLPPQKQPERPTQCDGTGDVEQHRRAQPTMEPADVRPQGRCGAAGTVRAGAAGQPPRGDRRVRAGASPRGDGRRQMSHDQRMTTVESPISRPSPLACCVCGPLEAVLVVHRLAMDQSTFSAGLDQRRKTIASAYPPLRRSLHSICMQRVLADGPIALDSVVRPAAAVNPLVPSSCMSCPGAGHLPVILRPTLSLFGGYLSHHPQRLPIRGSQRRRGCHRRRHGARAASPPPHDAVVRLAARLLCFHHPSGGYWRRG